MYADEKVHARTVTCEACTAAGGICSGPEDSCTPTCTFSGANGEVRAAGGKSVTPGVAFVPEVMYNGQWSPICGHYFWDNNNGAAAVCKILGFSGGMLELTHTAYSSDAMPVGNCNAGEALTSCTHGGNDWGNFESNHGYCKTGQQVGLTVTCGAKIG